MLGVGNGLMVTLRSMDQLRATKQHSKSMLVLASKFPESRPTERDQAKPRMATTPMYLLRSLRTCPFTIVSDRDDWLDYFVAGPTIYEKVRGKR